MVSVGLWSAWPPAAPGATCCGAPWALRPCCWWAPCWNLQGVRLPAVEPMIAASLLVTGLLVVSRLRVPGLMAALGWACLPSSRRGHGYELAGSDSASKRTLAGMLTATVLLHSAGLAAGWALRHRHVWLARAAGAGVAAFGGAAGANGLSIPCKELS